MVDGLQPLLTIQQTQQHSLCLYTIHSTHTDTMPVTLTDVVIGWDPSISAGEGIFCSGSESKLMDCSLYRVIDYPCTGGATIISCLPSGKRQPTGYSVL